MSNPLMLLVAVVTCSLLFIAFRLKPGPNSSLFLPMLVFSAGYSGIAFFLCGAAISLYRMIVYCVFFVAGLIAGIHALKIFHFFQRTTSNPITVFWILLPVCLLLGVGFYGLLAGLLASVILSHVTSCQLTGVSFGMSVGLIASFSSYVAWRIGVKWVWR